MINWARQAGVAVSRVGGHSVHGREDRCLQTNRLIDPDRFGLRIDGDKPIVLKISS